MLPSSLFLLFLGVAPIPTLGPLLLLSRLHTLRTSTVLTMDNARAFFNLEGKSTQVRTLVGAGEEQSGILPEVSTARSIQQQRRLPGADPSFHIHLKIDRLSRIEFLGRRLSILRHARSKRVLVHFTSHLGMNTTTMETQ